MAWYFADRGYEVIMFEGQGGALKYHQLYWNHVWEKPTAAVLDHYGCEEVTILGISMGVGYDFMAVVPGPLVTLVKFLFRFPGFFDRIS